MAKVEIYLTCEECGQEFRHAHYCGNRDQADSYEEWARDNITICPECWKKQKRTEERAQLDNQAESAKELDIDMPELTGTPKQIAWAEDIRLRAIKMFYDAKAKPATYDVIRHFTDAKFWIDHREYCDATKCNVRTLFTILKKEMEQTG